MNDIPEPSSFDSFDFAGEVSRDPPASYFNSRTAGTLLTGWEQERRDLLACLIDLEECCQVAPNSSPLLSKDLARRFRVAIATMKRDHRLELNESKQELRKSRDQVWRKEKELERSEKRIVDLENELNNLRSELTRKSLIQTPSVPKILPSVVSIGVDGGHNLVDSSAIREKIRRKRELESRLKDRFGCTTNTSPESRLLRHAVVEPERSSRWELDTTETLTDTTLSALSLEHDLDTLLDDILSQNPSEDLSICSEESPLESPAMKQMEELLSPPSEVFVSDMTTDMHGSSSHSLHCVSFRSVQVRLYHQTLGDNPSTTNGPAITLDWNYAEIPPMDIDRFETHREPRRAKNPRDLFLSSVARRLVLSNKGFSEEDFAANAAMATECS